MDGGGGVASDGGGSDGGSVESMIDVQLCPELNNFKQPIAHPVWGKSVTREVISLITKDHTYSELIYK